LAFWISGKMKCLTCIRETSSVAGTEEDASNNAGTPESGRVSCGMIGDSCTTLDVCWIGESMSNARLDQKEEMIMLPGLVKQLFWLFWRASVESGVKIQISDRYQKVMNGQKKYLNYRRYLRGNLLGVLLVCIFGGCVLEYRMI